MSISYVKRYRRLVRKGIPRPADLIQLVTTRKEETGIPPRYGAQIKLLVNEAKINGEGVLDLRQRRVMEMIMEMTMKIHKPFHFLTYSSVRQVGFGNDQGFLMDMKHCLLCLTTRG
jgi:hypothetical protein